MGRKKNRFYKDLSVKKLVDTNVLVIDSSADSSLPVQMTTSTPAISDTSSSSKKQRQLEKYIAKKLKKEERPALLERLAKASFGDASLQLQSTKALLVPSKRTLSKQILTDQVGYENNANEQTSSENDDSDNEGEQDQEQTDKKVITCEIESRKVLNSVSEISIGMVNSIASLKKSSLNPLDSSSDDDNDNEDKTSSNQLPPLNKSLPVPDENDDDDMIINDTITRLMPACPTFNVLVERTKIIEDQRIKLPIYAEEQTVMETIMNNPVTIICGETGSGKTTQVPQFLYEAGFGDPSSSNPGLIGVTQPRRVAAISMAKRIGEELNTCSRVAYQIRYDSSTMSPETRIKLMTDGILLRELADDFLLCKYSIILLDEAHERNLNTDILIGMLSRVVRMRNQLTLEKPGTIRPLRLVIMSATLNITEFVNIRLFDPLPPVIKVDARQHPVTCHFSRTTESDHDTTAYNMIRKIHTNLPPGGILVFLTGKQEIMKLVNRLNKRQEKLMGTIEDEDVDNFDSDSASGSDSYSYSDSDSDSGSGSETFSRNDNHHVENDNNDNDKELVGKDEAAKFDLDSKKKGKGREPLYVLPLYSLLAPEEQLKVFQPPPEGHRLCVIATNVAETSLTIPNVRYVVDCGKVKEYHFDPSTGIGEHRVEWCSKASATQRAGRAGRLGPGHCYRLYSSAVFDRQFSDFSSPEIQRSSIDSLVLRLKSMGIDRPENFPLPTPPPIESFLTAQKSLHKLGALAKKEKNEEYYCITPLGRKMSLVPLAPIWSRLVVMAIQLDCCPVGAMALASVLSSGDPFLDNASKEVKLKMAGKPNGGDLAMWFNVFLSYYHQARSDKKLLCQKLDLMPKRMEEISQQFGLLCKTMEIDKTALPSKIPRTELESLYQLLAESLSEKTAERIQMPPPQLAANMKRINLPAYRLFNCQIDDPKAIAYLHPTSIMAKTPPPYLIYTELSLVNDIQYIKYVIPIKAGWLPSAATI